MGEGEAPAQADMDGRRGGGGGDTGTDTLPPGHPASC